MPLVSLTASPDLGGGDLRDAVVPLAVVVGADIEKLVLLPAVPPHDLPVRLDARRGLARASAAPLFRQGREEPASGEDRVAFQKLAGPRRSSRRR